MAAFGIADGDAERFRADVRANMERELRQRTEAKVKSQVMDALIEANPVVLPAVLVAEEIAALKGQTRQAAGGGNLELPDELFAESAERRVKLGLVVAEVVKQHELKPSPERVRALVEELAATYERPDEVVNYYYADPQRLSSVEALATEELVVERMLETAEVVEEPSSFDALTETEGMRT
jgi:trigger factor